MTAIFRQLAASTDSDKAKGISGDEWYFVCAQWEMTDDVQTGLLFAVTDGKSAWTSKISGEEFQTLVASCRIGESRLEDFVDHTTKALTNSPSPPANKKSKKKATEEYIVDAKLSPDHASLDFKWKLRESGFTVIIGQLSLPKAEDAARVMNKIHAVVFDVVTRMNSESQKQKDKRDETKEAMRILKNLRDRPDQKDKILDQCVETINEAKKRNRDRGGTSEGFQKAWTQATQADVIDGDDAEMSDE